MSFLPKRHGFLRDKSLVIFGVGYVGAALARVAQAAGARVAALTRNPTKAAALAGESLTTVVADLATSSWHEHPALQVADYVLNCVSSAGGGAPGYRHSYVDGAESILAWGQRGGVSRAHLIYTGSTSVYPEAGGRRVDEAAASAEAGPLAGILLEAEQRALAWPGPATVLRLAGIYGPGRHYLLDALRAGEATVAGRGDFALNLIHRDDIVAAILATWARPAETTGRVFNVADDGAAPKAEVVDWLAGRLGRLAPAFTGLPAGGRRQVPPHRIVANDRLKAATDWTPAFPSFREGYAAILGT
jgi:nucleoside-diphosphate-sugar epimerase